MIEVFCERAERCLFALATVVSLAVPSFAVAAEEAGEPVIEEVIVTAQRVAERLADVPIAVTALSGDVLDDRQVVNPSDLQLNAPNVSFTATNFGGSSFGIRGVGSLVIGRTAEPGVSAHLNEIAISGANLNSLEFFDMERVEILRGPQGTLFGRNATGGTINFVTRKPEMGKVSGFVDFEAGDYDHYRGKAALNLPLGDMIAIRLAGYKLDRNGYIENLAYGMEDARGNPLSGIDEDIDGRDIRALRATLKWRLSDRANAWGLYSRFEERDDRARITNQVCERNSLPTTGCTPDGFGWDTPHLGASTAGIFGGSAGALPLGDSGVGLSDIPRPRIDGFRQTHTDFEPVFDDQEEVWAFGVEFDFDRMKASLSGARRDGEYLSQQDYWMDVGQVLEPTALNPLGVWPTSRPAGGAGAEWRSDSCNLNDATSGILGGCRQPAAQNRVFAYDQLDSVAKYWTVEAKVHSQFEGPFGFVAGASVYEDRNYGGYYVLANTLDLVTTYGVLGLPPSYPGFFYNGSNPDGGAVSEGWASFGEIYYDLSDRLELTFGLRYNEDRKSVSDTSALFNALDANAALGGVLGTDRIWVRTGLLLELLDIAGSGGSLGTQSMRLLEFWDAESVFSANEPAAIATIGAINSAQLLAWLIQRGELPPDLVPAAMRDLGLLPVQMQTVLALLSQDPAAIAGDAGLQGGRAALAALAAAIPPVPGFGETRFITGSPSDAAWNELSARLGFDYRLRDDTLVYGFVSHGYKPGGFNPAIPPAFQATSAFTFDAEGVTAFEVGAKRRFFGGRLGLNAAGFLYDYGGMQVTRIRNNTSLNENIDAHIAGLEVEGVWRPEAIPQLAVDFAFGWLDSKVEGSRSVDPINRTGGNGDYVLLNNIDPGSLTGVNYVARESQITQGVVDGALQAGRALDIRNGATARSVSHPANGAGVSIPVYFSRGFLAAAGVETLDGIPVNLDGNTLPNSPGNTLRLGVAYTMSRVVGGALTLRWDYYRQGESYAREFNTLGDRIDSWDQHNAMAIYDRGSWTTKAWVRNIGNADNVTGKYLTSDTSGFFRNYFLTEPRIFGVSLRYDFGD